MRRIAVVTGTRAEWGLLRSVCSAIDAHAELELVIVAGGAHFLPPVPTIHEVRSFGAPMQEFSMQREGETGRLADAAAFGRGVTNLASIVALLTPDVVVVLGDRIEALAAASAASIGGICVAHIHGGDRAEGVADEAMRHAITKLAHIHFPASPKSAERIERMGEDPSRIHCTGSPAVDGLAAIPAMSDARYAALSSPQYVVLFHPCGRSDSDEHADATTLLAATSSRGRVLALRPNADAGNGGIVQAIAEAIERTKEITTIDHLARDEFIGLLKRPEVRALVGNSSAGLLEAAALGTRTLNLGNRQRGRERAENVVDCVECSASALHIALTQVEALAPVPSAQFGNGQTGVRIAELLASADPNRYSLAKHNTF